ncbi:MAG: hypothetical protein M1490_01045 [Candidatus Bathyarchaeota archaeon]|nr:hypothetical protein [Candidatus Bathyarchaeota archaeon]
MEAKTTITIPEAYRVIVEDLRLLQRDGQNPNKMTEKQKASTWKSLCDFGWIYPIVTNKDGMLTDGEQRVDVCLEHSEFFGPVLRLPVEDVDRRILRQVLNKLKGTHDKLLDAQEFKRIREAGGKEELQGVLGITDETFDRYDKLLDDAENEQGALLDSSFEVVVKCKDEPQQQERFGKLKDMWGEDVRILTL